jgi:alkylglycerol monooxygenase
MEKIVVYAFPVFGLLIIGEYAYGLAIGRNTYRINDAISSLSQGILSQITLVFTQIFKIGIYTQVYGVVPHFHTQEFWGSWYGWLIALVLVDFCNYWNHRYTHEIGILWGGHMVHHQSQEFNFSTALRQEIGYPILGWIFTVPLAVIGLPPDIFAVTGLVVLLYQFWIHTEHVGKLGWFDRIFSSPSNHRVHHGVNDAYINKNYGNILIIWDRMFGTFVEEGEEKCIYGTRVQFDSWDPLWANWIVYWNLIRDAWRAERWLDKIRIWFMPPGWKPQDVEERHPSPEFDLSAIKIFDPPMSRNVTWFACAQFLILLAASSALLWHMDDLTFRASAVLVITISAGLWAMGKAMEGSMSINWALFVDAIAILCAMPVV